MESRSRFAAGRKALIFWCLFIGLGAVAGGICMLIDPTGKMMGMDALLPYFQVLPFAECLFQDFVFSGIALLIVNGLTNLISAWSLLTGGKSGIVLGGIFGVTLMLWICIQFVIFPFNFMSTAYFIFGFVQAVTGYMTWVFYKQEQFSVDVNDYPDIGRDHTRLVVYFSRMGYTKKVALEAANAVGGDVYEIKAKERTEGTAGFWWCGRFGMHRWEMPIEEPMINIETYDHVTVCTPIWVFCVAAPVRSFCNAFKGKIKEADYILVHYQKMKYAKAAGEMDCLLGLENSPAVSICCRRGEYVKKEKIN